MPCEMDGLGLSVPFPFLSSILSISLTSWPFLRFSHTSGGHSLEEFEEETAELESVSLEEEVEAPFAFP